MLANGPVRLTVEAHISPSGTGPIQLTAHQAVSVLASARLKIKPSNGK
jgi:hypothetical protein